MPDHAGRAPLRADAVRNRANILRAARTLIAARGEQAGMDEIAREAGVAVGTLYRHFPTKADLVGAIVAEMIERVFSALDAAVARVEAGGGALAAITDLLREISEAAGTDRAVKEALVNRADGTHPYAELDQRARDGLARLVAAAHAEGTLRDDVTTEDLVLILATLPGDELPEPARRRWLRLALRGVTREDLPD
ncbi:TetR/AcrR family transcriptional regulator [Allostreptomyces psammosilenae]|uniref:AcrR family transcriptional regulator n=1 Tax=Allostreptomyces psammosilenae TaxID=1892865 RepID=A0A852ZZF0_9ACTN|nr:TetR/AcrR family transcriptional regulator [Allostreptomyces psammosilenae]NYI07716.1 AcrR family transcriptional regulator [Allostreptomyces psammosilenae]